MPTLLAEPRKANSRPSEPEPAQGSSGASSMGSPAGVPAFLQFFADPQVQFKCAKCQEEEEEAASGTQVQKCSCCGGGSCKHDERVGIHNTARGGVANASQPVPHLDRIQSSFGRHDVSGARAVVGGEAESANRNMGSLAYAAGDRIAFQRQ